MQALKQSKFYGKCIEPTNIRMHVYRMYMY